MSVNRILGAGTAMIVMGRAEPGREIIVGVVARLGFEPQVYTDAGTALDTIEYDLPVLVVHGFDLPDMDGATFHAAVRRRAGGIEIPTLAVIPEQTHHRPGNHFVDQMGIEEYILRPFDADDLASRLEALLSPRKVSSRPASETDTDRVEVGAGESQTERREPVGATPQRSPEDEASSPHPARLRPSASPDEIRMIGLGEWGVGAAEAFAERGFAARGFDTGMGVERSELDASRRHRIELPNGSLDQYARAARSLAENESLAWALAEDAEGDLFILAADLGSSVGALLPVLLRRVADVAPSAGRLAVVRLPGLRSSPDEKALGLVALNAVLTAPPSGILLVQSGSGYEAGDPRVPATQLLDLFDLAGGRVDESIIPVGSKGIGRALSTAGFIGWREIELTREACAQRADAWHSGLAGARVGWEPHGFAWSEAHTILAIVKAPQAWLDAGGRDQYDRFVQAAWDEAAPCEVESGLYAGEPARATLVSAGIPFPQGILDLRDSVEADRRRMEEKRQAASTLIPLGDDFLPGSEAVITGTTGIVVELEVAPEEPETDVAPELAPEPELPVPVEPPVWTEPSDAETGGVDVADTAAEVAELEAVEPKDFEPPAEPPESYESALALTGRILAAKDLRAEVDLGDIRYALYDLLEVLREQPEALLPEVFRPEADSWFERHHVNVAVLALLAGDLLQGSLSEVIDLGTAALLHDIGMIPSRATWDTPESFSSAAFERDIRPHPEMGFRLLQEIAGMTGTIARMVLEEHERMDGTGYPEGLASDKIDPGARVLAVCDTLEALTHPRPHRSRISVAEALERVRAFGQFTLDSAVVTALVDEVGEQLARGNGSLAS